LPKHYLWALDLDTEKYPPGTRLGDRYQVKQDQIVLDTTPGLTPALPVEISLEAESYLRLIAQRPQTPELYGITVLEDETEITLLENTAIFPAQSLDPDTGEELSGSLMPALVDRWDHGSPQQKLAWLKQLAELWTPLQSNSVGMTLFHVDLLRVEGSLIRLLELVYDRSESLSLADLGYCWKDWFIEASAAQSHCPFTSFLEHLCDGLIQHRIKEITQLIEVLDHELAQLEISTIQVQLVTATDQGPSRQRNEDACYPPNKVSFSLPSNASEVVAERPLLMVCDGIGGHEGGDVASQLAIATLIDNLSQISDQTPEGVINSIQQAVNQANDQICHRNDSEGRSDRQRMGTTLVMALISGYRLYLTHVGDSRAYRLTRSGLHQLTLDDDLACREVRLGYAFYREALQHSSSGSLTQALGMVQANMLHPTIRTWELAEDAVYVLCSDGLSDFDRLQECWRSDLVPLLDGTISLEAAAQRLIEVANTRNGHDNVTVGLLSVQVPRSPVEPRDVGDRWAARPDSQPHPSSTAKNTRLVVGRPLRRGIPIPLLFLGVSLLGLFVGFSLLPFSAELRSWFNPAPKPSVPAPSGLIEKQWVQLQPNPNLPESSSEPTGMFLLPEPGRQASSASQSQQPDASQAGTNPLNLTVGWVSPGTVMQVVERKILPDQTSWLRLQVCAVPKEVENTVQRGVEGWHAETTIAPWLKPIDPPTTEATCAAAATPVSQPVPMKSIAPIAKPGS
jgi:protein phosphatase